MKRVSLYYSSHVAMAVGKPSLKRRPLERPDAVALRKGYFKEPNRHNTSGTSTRDLRVLLSGLCSRCTSLRAMAATKIQKTLPLHFVLSVPRVAEIWYRSRSLSGVTNWTKSVMDGGAAAPSVWTLPTYQSTSFMKDMGWQKSASTSPRQTRKQLRHAKKTGLGFAAWRSHCEKVSMQWQ